MTTTKTRGSGARTGRRRWSQPRCCWRGAGSCTKRASRPSSSTTCARSWRCRTSSPRRSTASGATRAWLSVGVHPSCASVSGTHSLSYLTHAPAHTQAAEDQAAGGQVRLPPHHQPHRAPQRSPRADGEQVGLPPVGAQQVHQCLRGMAVGQVRGQGGWQMGISRTTRWLSHPIYHTTRRWGHLLTFTAARVGPRVPAYAQAVGEKIGLEDPAQCRVFGFVDGVFLCVACTCCWCWVSGHSSHGAASNLTPRAPRQHNTRRTGTPAGRVSSRRGCTTATTRATGTNSRPS